MTEAAIDHEKAGTFARIWSPGERMRVIDHAGTENLARAYLASREELARYRVELQRLAEGLISTYEAQCEPDADPDDGSLDPFKAVDCAFRLLDERDAEGRASRERERRLEEALRGLLAACLDRDGPYASYEDAERVARQALEPSDG